MPRHHFIAKLVPGGGPPPLRELESIVVQVGDGDTGPGWFATRKPGAGWQSPSAGTDAVCIVFFVNREEHCIDAVVAKILSRRDYMPDVATVREIHEGYTGFRAWWELGDPIRVRLPSLDSIPGQSEKGKTARESFSGNSTFAYWTFQGDNERNIFDRVTGSLELATVQPTPTTPPQVHVARPEPAVQAEDVALWNEALTKLTRDVHGVDFSGGQEGVQGNPKIWVASWQIEHNTITLQRGLCRNELPERVRTNEGLWVFDFPFGVVRETAAAILDAPEPSWSAWLEWCASGQSATQLRDQARQRTTAAGIKWSTRRLVDEEHQTTWFPLFEQLYKQTIYGAGQVLLPLFNLSRDDVCILPWHELGDAKVAVLEGFPGVTIRQRLKPLAPSGYKGRRPEHRHKRQAIIDVLKAAPYGLPIPTTVESQAVADTEGDAVDALVLLIAAWVSHALDSALWEECRENLQEEGRLVEGWFPA